MSFGEVAKASLDTLASRFFRTGYLPTYAGAMFVLVVVWAGAPGSSVSFGRAWRIAAALGVAEVLLIVVCVTVAAVLFQPLQLAMVRVLEGGWPAGLGTGVGLALQRRRKRWLAAAARLPDGPGEPAAEVVQRAGIAAARLRRRYPLPDHLVRPTALGNVLSAAEDTAGREYGWDAVVAWPRLYTVLGDRTRALVDDRRDALDGAVRLSVTGGVVALLTFVLLLRASWWVTLALAPLAVAVLAYLGAVHTAMAYGEAVHTAFDMHRFDLLSALHLPLPANQGEERAQAVALCDWWRQGVPVRLTYDHGSTSGG
jgi:hypothetical protein